MVYECFRLHSQLSNSSYRLYINETSQLGFIIDVFNKVNQMESTKLLLYRHYNPIQCLDLAKGRVIVLPNPRFSTLFERLSDPQTNNY